MIRKETRAAYWKYVESIIIPDNAEKPTDTQKLWTFIKHRKVDSVGIAPLKDKGELKDAPHEKAAILNAQFSSVFTQERPLEDLPDEQPDTEYPHIDELSISTDGIQKLLEGLNPNKQWVLTNSTPEYSNNLPRP